MSVLSPMWLWALLVIPVLVGFAVQWVRQRGRAAAAFADPRVMVVGSGPSARLSRRTALGLAIVAVAMGPIALARPAVDTTDDRRQGAVMLAIDTSESMRKTDLAPDRLAAAREAANRFLDEAPDESLIGLVSFNDRAVVQVAPTLDRVAVRSALDRLEIREGTALGSAVVASLGSLAGAGVLETLSATPRQSAGRIMVMSDGAGNVGITPDEANLDPDSGGLLVWDVPAPRDWDG